MHREWNPKFGFFLPCESNLKNVSMSVMTRENYSKLHGPYPLEEFCSNDDPINVRLDQFIGYMYSTEIISERKDLDMIILCDYSCIYHARNFFVTSVGNPELKIDDALISNTLIIKSNTDKNRIYVSPPVSSHYFTTKETSLHT
jgi:hypothetical protein